MRLKNRYLLLELKWKDGRCDESIQESTIQSAIRDSTGVNFGDYGLAMSAGSMHVKYFNPLTNMCMVRCSRDQLQEVKPWPTYTSCKPTFF
jgi:ribonuclease P/MRP protein subunit POP5